MTPRQAALLKLENKRLRARVKRLEAEQRQAANCVRAMLKLRKDGEKWLKELSPRKYLSAGSEP